MKENKSRTRIIIATLMSAIILVAAIVSIVAVLAAYTQNMQTNINIHYIVEGVGAKAQATYAMIPDDTMAEITRVSMTNGDSEEVEFFVKDSQSDAQMTPNENLQFSTNQTQIVFEYVFENTAETAFSVQLIETPEIKQNMTERYLVSGTRLAARDYRTKITDETLPAQAVTSLGDKIYIYISAYVTNTNLNAHYEGTYTWALLCQDTIDINLNTDGTVTTLKVIPSANVEGIMMPTITPPLKDRYAFEGYYTASDGAGTKYINSLGAGAHIADVSAGTTLYAHYNEMYTVSGTTLTGLTETAKQADSITISDNITEIGANAFAGAQATSVTIPNTVTTIRENAFANNKNLTEVNFEPVGNAYADGEGLKTLGKRAFYNCTGLTELVIPSTVTSIASGALAGCDNLRKLEFPYVIDSYGIYDDYNGAYISSAFAKIFLSANSESYYDDEYGEYFPNFTNSDIPSSLYEVIINGGTSIGEMAFYDCSDIKRMTIPSSINTINSGASQNGDYCPFSGTQMLQVKNLSGCWMYGFNYDVHDGCEINLSYQEVLTTDTEFTTTLEMGKKYTIFTGTNGIKRLLSANKNITSATDIPSDVKVIEDRAFYGCDKFISVTMPDGITGIGSSAFGNCSNLTRVNITDLAAWCNIMFASGDSNPLYYAKNLYLNNNLVTSLEIPSSITTIKNYAFYGCSVLTSVTIGDSVTSIGTKAFSYCSNLTSFTIPNSVTSIGSYAFYYCSGLTSVTIGNSVTSIGGSAFYSCEKLNKVNILDIAKWCNIDFSDNSSNPLWLGRYLYLNNNLITILEIPTSVTTIKKFAFYNCYNINKIIIPSSVTSIGSAAFYGCEKLVQVKNLSGKTMSDYSKPSYAEVLTTDTAFTTTLEVNEKYSIFTGTDGIKRLVAANQNITIADDIPNDVKEISDYAFYQNTRLLKVVIPDNVTTIGWNVFYKCSSLASVTIGSSVTTIGSNEFSGCSSLTSIVIPDSVTSMGGYAFKDCTSLVSAVLGNGLTTTGNSTFKNCSNLTSVTFGDSIASIGSDSFYGCTSLTNMIIPNSVTKIESQAFRNCNNLTSVTIPNSVTSIGNSAFSGCYALVQVKNLSGKTMNGYSKPSYAEVLTTDKAFTTTVEVGKKYSIFTGKDGIKRLIAANKNITSANDIPSDIKTIEQYAFDNCRKLTSVTIPDSVTSIGSYAFQSCSSLTSVTIGDSVTSIGNYAFNNCSKLTKVNITDLAAWCNITFSNYYANPLYNAKKLYLNNNLVTSLEIPSNITTIKPNAFYNCSSLTSITIPNSVISIGTYAFYNCSSLTSVIIPNSVTSIGNSAFSDCSSLTSVTIPNSVTSIGNYAFYNCSSLTSVTIPASVTSIGSYAFNNCNSLATATYSGAKSDLTIGESNTNLTDILQYYYGWTISRVEPTCQAAGKIIYSNGTRTFEEPIAKLPHKLNENKVCTVCGTEITLEISISTGSECGDAYYSFNQSGDWYYSTNNEYEDGEDMYCDTTARAEIAIIGSGQITIDWEVSSEDDCDILTIHKGNKDYVRASGEDSGTVTIDVSDGDVIIIEYSKDGSVYDYYDRASFKVTIVE